jgi:two-component system, OmpR family, alkaline phosphatase synthesis response regulator PhoP
MATEFEQEVRNSTILIADDIPQNVELLQAYLEELGCKIVTAFDGEETLQRVEESKPDLILLDIMMPRLSGFEICRKLKSVPATAGIPICMVTALNEEGDIERAVEAGTDDFLSKPVNRWELLTRVRSLLRVRHLQNELERTLSYLEEVDQARGGDED